MTAWNPDLYMQFGNERTQPAIDLISRINLTNPKRIVDCGCGSGNSTAVLRRRWPQAQIIGMDSSPEMLTEAKNSTPNQEWLLDDIKSWRPSSQVDLIFSNAALHWIPDHAELISRLFGQVASGGALAFQIPSVTQSILHSLIHDTANHPEWQDRMIAAKAVLTSETAAFYYDVLGSKASSIDIWETEYFHVMADHDKVIDWLTSTRLRPFLDCLKTRAEQRKFLSNLHERLLLAFPQQKNGKILFPFRRLFLIAYLRARPEIT